MKNFTLEGRRWLEARTKDAVTKKQNKPNQKKKKKKKQKTKTQDCAVSENCDHACVCV